MSFVFNDGGRAAAGFRGRTADCVTRAIAIACRMPYAEVYDAINDACRTSRERGESSARTGVSRSVYEAFLKARGWEWVPTMRIGEGCRVHLRAEELPSGRLIARCSRHLVAVVDGVVHDTHDSTRDGRRCVYGYFRSARFILSIVWTA